MISAMTLKEMPLGTIFECNGKKIMLTRKSEMIEQYSGVIIEGGFPGDKVLLSGNNSHYKVYTLVER